MRGSDIALDDLASSEAALWEGVASPEAERNIYRELAQQAIHALHAVTRDRDRLRAAHHRLLGEYRALRTPTMREAIGREAA